MDTIHKLAPGRTIFFARVRTGQGALPGQYRTRPYVFYCEAINATPDGVYSRCLNLGFDMIVKDDGTFKLRTGETAHVELIADPTRLKFRKSDHSAAVEYFHKRMSAPK